MQKSINVYEYVSYNNLLSDDYMKRSTLNPNYSLRAYARDLGLSVGYLSKVMNRKNNLSIQKGLNIFERLGHSGEELDYLKQLIIYNTSEEKNKKESAFKYIKKHFGLFQYRNDPKKDKVLESVDHFLVYTMVKQFSEKRVIEDMMSKLDISRENYERVLRELIQEDYIKEKNNCLFITDSEYIIVEHDQLHIFHEKFSSFVLKNMVKKGHINNKDSKGHGVVIKMDDKSLDEIIECMGHCMRKIYDISDKVKKPTHIAFYSNSMVAFENLEENNISKNLN